MAEEDNSSDSSSTTDTTGSRIKRAAKGAGRSLSSGGQAMMAASRDEAAASIRAQSFKRGGKVRKTGLANLHSGERVIPRGKVKRVEKMMRKSKMRMKAKR